MKAFKTIGSILFIICIPILLLTTDLRLAATDIRLYQYGFDKYEVSVAAGMDDQELLAVAEEIISYFNSDEEYLDVEVFDEREIAHMKDVKSLIRLAYVLQLASLSYIVVYALLGFVLRRGAFLTPLARLLFWGSGLTVAVVVVIGLWALADFRSLFLVFHLVSFRNDLWLLSPGDMLLLMFPQGFFNEAALIVGGAAIAEAVAVGSLAWVVLRVVARRGSDEGAGGPDGDGRGRCQGSVAG